MNKFSRPERDKIIQTHVINKDNQWYGIRGGNDTQDHIFLLSLEEVVGYFGDSGQLQNRTTSAYWIADQFSGGRIAYNMLGNNRWWWLRSPGNGGGHAANVVSDGSVDLIGCPVINHFGGVRPALWLKM